jgi:hypothetical protein
MRWHDGARHGVKLFVAVRFHRFGRRDRLHRVDSHWGFAMRKLSVAVVGIAWALSLQASSASTPIAIHFIYAKPGASYDQFQGDRDVCARQAKRPHYQPGMDGRYFVEDWPSSTVFLNCMAKNGYAMTKDGWDTGVLWTLPYLRRPR